jgi:glycosyltransferase involved in cell wall biosynthesis
MKCVFVCCFDLYNLRIKPIEEFLISKGYDCYYITSDFDHIKKKKYEVERESSIQIKVPKYNKNISINRIISHFVFAREAYKEAKRLNPDLIYIILPPNSLVYYFSRFKRKNKLSEVKLIFDIYDLWPESFPSKGAKTILSVPFKIWRLLRDNYISTADLVITECNLFKNALSNVLKDVNTKTLYLAKNKGCINNQAKLNDLTNLHLCYLGSINSLIDIPVIKKLIEKINYKKPVFLHIIGDGESRDKLIEEVKCTGATVKYYGKVYNSLEKEEIFNKCHFGLNIMKDSVCVGLTMKSIDYFQAGLPILNNIEADTTKIVEELKVGFNIQNDSLEEIATKVVNLNSAEVEEMRFNTSKVFNDIFSIEAHYKKLESIFKTFI